MFWDPNGNCNGKYASAAFWSFTLLNNSYQKEQKVDQKQEGNGFNGEEDCKVQQVQSDSNSCFEQKVPHEKSFHIGALPGRTPVKG